MEDDVDHEKRDDDDGTYDEWWWSWWSWLEWWRGVKRTIYAGILNADKDDWQGWWGGRGGQTCCDEQNDKLKMTCSRVNIHSKEHLANVSSFHWLLRFIDRTYFLHNLMVIPRPSLSVKILMKTINIVSNRDSQFLPALAVGMLMVMSMMMMKMMMLMMTMMMMTWCCWDFCPDSCRPCQWRVPADGQ